MRNNKIVFTTKEQLIEEDVPYQLCQWNLNDDDDDDDEKKHEKNVKKLFNQKGRRIKDSEDYNFQVKNNDIVIAGTDGFFDNISNDEIINCEGDIDKLMEKTISNVIKKKRKMMIVLMTSLL